MKKKLVTLLLLLCTCGTPAFAANWYFLGHNNYSTLYIDNASVQKNPREAWVTVKYTHPDGSASIDRLFVNRRNRTTALLATTAYRANGTVASHYTYTDLHYVPIIPESMSELIYYAIWRR